MQMATKKKETTHPVFKMYVTQAGIYIGGEEVQRTGAVLEVNDPVFVTSSADGTGYEFKPVQFVSAGESLQLYTYGLLGDAAMPSGMVAWFTQYRSHRAKQAELQP